MVTRLTKGRLKVTISETRAELGEVAAREVGAYIRSLLETKPEVNIIFASAPSQNDFLANLLLEEIDWSRVNAFHMDEYIGIDPHAPQAFGQFLRDRIFSKKTFKSVNYIDSKAADPAAECERYAGLLRQMPADIVFLGIGENGHLAFNEPQPELTAEQFAQLPTRVLDIHPETRATNCVGDLGGALEDMPRKCVTIGMKEILGARKLRLGVFRDWHRAVCRRAAYGEVTAAFPATLAQNHPDALLYVNANAAQTAY